MWLRFSGPAAGDTLTKTHAQGGLHLDRFAATAVIALAMVALVASDPNLRRPSSSEH